MKTADQINQDFDNLKMNRSYEEMLKLLEENAAVLAAAGWKLMELENKINQILKLERTI